MNTIKSLAFFLALVVCSGVVKGQSSAIQTDKEYHSNKQLKKKWEYYVDEWSEKRILHGRLSEWDRDGKLMYEAKYEEGKLHGLTIHYHENGEIEHIETFEEGVKEGPFYESRSDGSLIVEGNYEKGKLQGPVIHYNKKGKVTKKLVYQKGKRLSGSRLKEMEEAEKASTEKKSKTSKEMTLKAQSGKE